MTQTRRGLSAVLLTTRFAAACANAQTDDEERIAAARSQAMELLAILRAGEWAKATDFVLLDEAARIRFDLPKDIDRPSIARRVEELFRDLYEEPPPGSVSSVRLDPYQTGDVNLVQVTYRHGDLDAFLMRLIDGRWMYSFE